MKIKQIEIYGYGKWIDQIFEVDESLQVFYGGNEAGKTTLMSFVHSVLFGFPHRQSSELRYEPKKGSRYGGKLIAQDARYGEVSIERVKGRASGEVTIMLENGQTGSDTLLNELLYGMDREWYQSIFSFNLEGIQHIERMTKEKLNRYFLSAGTLGTEQFLKEADRLNTLASKLYKPTGRVPDINRKLKDVETKRKQVESAKKKNAQYAELVKEKQTAEQKVMDIREQLMETEETLQKLRQLEREWPQLEEICSLQEEVLHHSSKALPEDGLHQLSHFNKELESLRNAEIQEQEKIRQYQQTFRPSTLLHFYQENEQQFSYMLNELDNVRVKLMHLEQVVQDEEEMKHRLLKEKLRTGLNPIDKMPNPLSQDETKELAKWNGELESIEKQLTETQSQLSLLEYRRQSLFEEIDTLESSLWPSQEYEEVHKFISQRTEGTEPADSQHDRKQQSKSNWLFIFAGTVFMAASLFMAPPVQWMAGAAGLAALLSGILVSMRKNREPADNDERKKAPHSYEDYIKQTEMRKNWRIKLAESDQNEQQIQQTEKEKVQTMNGKQAILSRWENMKEEKRFPETWSIDQMAAKEEELASIRQEEMNLEEKRKQKNEINAYLNKWRQSLEVIREELDFSSSHSDLYQQVKRMFQAVKEEEKSQQEYLYRTREAHNELERLIKETRKTETKKRRLLEATGVGNEEELRRLYALNEEINQKKARLNLLTSQMSESLDWFEQYKGKEELIERLEAAKEQHQQLKLEEEKKTDFKIQKEVEIRKLEEGGDYAVLLQEYENTKSELQSLVDEWASLKVAADLIERTLNYAKKDRLPGTILDAEEYFLELTEGNYTKIKLDQDSLKVLHKNGLLYDASELSRGTAEQLYVSLRLAFIENIQDAIELPLLVDDGFVNFDFSRKQRIWKLLEKISRKNQVLYFTFDTEAVEEMQQAAVAMLY